MRNRGLVVVGMAHDSNKDKSIEVVKQAKAEFPITEGGELYGISVSAFPTYTLFDRRGQMIHNLVGDYESLKAEIEKALKQEAGEDSIHLDIPVETYRQQSVIRLAQKANDGKDLGKLLGDIQKKVNAGSPAEKEEAIRLKNDIVAYADKLMAQAEQYKAQGRPNQHFDALNDLAWNFKGHDIGKKADGATRKIMADKTAMRDIEAARLYEKLEFAGDKERESIYNVLKKKYADTRYNEQAKKLMETGVSK